MPSATDIETVRSEALRKVGRNVVNFQKVEACLKFLVVASRISGTPTTVAERISQDASTVRRQSLGDLTKSLNRRIFDGKDEPVAPQDLSELWASISLTVDGDPDWISQRKQALKKLVEERNRLIHHDLARFDYDSVQSCRQLTELLDAQNPRILEQLSTLKTIIDTLKLHMAELQAWVDSDDFLRDFELKPTDS